MKVLPDGFGGFRGDYGGPGLGGGLLNVAEAAEVGQQALAGLRTYAGDFQQLGVAVAHGATLAVVADSEAVALVANELDEMKDGGAAVEDDGLFFLAVKVDDFLIFLQWRLTAGW
jgi:hypothetical protein